MADDQPRCTTCNKAETDLSTPLKSCAACHIPRYCSRDCQKADWKTHKASCTSTSQDGVQRTKLRHAQDMVDLLNALARCRGFKIPLQDMAPGDAGLKYLYDFTSRTFNEYLNAILPPKIWADYQIAIVESTEADGQAYRQRIYSRYEELKVQDPDSWAELNAWPPSNAANNEKYSDCKIRNAMSAGIVLSKAQQNMMGGQYDYTEEVQAIARRMQQT